MGKKWVYDLTIHSSVELMASSVEEEDWRERPDSEIQVISCDEQGRCFFDEVLRPNTKPFLRLLNKRGGEGWELVQFSHHTGYLYLLWKKEANE